jgi:hypothetical protein
MPWYIFKPRNEGISNFRTVLSGPEVSGIEGLTAKTAYLHCKGDI